MNRQHSQHLIGSNVLRDHPQFYGRSDADAENSPIRIFDLSNPDLQVAGSMATETIDVSGIDVEIHHTTDSANADRLWDEDADPTYWPSVPARAYCPPGMIELLTKPIGSDAPIKIKLTFSMQWLAMKFGDRAIRHGDVIYVPLGYFGSVRPKYYLVENATPIGPYNYCFLYLECACESVKGDITILPKGDLNQGQDGDVPPEIDR